MVPFIIAAFLLLTPSLHKYGEVPITRETGVSHKDSQKHGGELPLILHPESVTFIYIRKSSHLYDPVTVNLIGKYHWQLLFYIDNSNNSGSYVKRYQYETSMTHSYSNLQREALEEGAKAGLELDASGVVEVVKVNFKSNVEQSISRAYETTVQKKWENHTSTKITEEFVVGPNSVMIIYRLMYSGPGVTYATETVSSKPVPIEDVKIDCKVQQQGLLRDIDVVYTDSSSQRPRDLIEDAIYGEHDINRGFGGKFVWLVPSWTKSRNQSATSWQVAVQNDSNPYLKDLAKGAGGDYRYLIRMFNGQAANRMNRVGLLRGPEKGGNLYNRRHEFGWDECTQDINQGRRGDYLHLCWNTIRA